MVLMFLSTMSFSQERHCGTMQYMERLKSQDPDVEKRMQLNEELIANYSNQMQNQRTASTVVTIPVVFHILYTSTSPFLNISTARILDQLATLNADYSRHNTDTANTPAPFKGVAANTNIQFCLATRDPYGNFTTGIIRKQVTASGFDPITNDNIKFSSLGGDDAWSTKNYLNIWVANFNGASSSLLGISQMPGQDTLTDGCCVLYSTVGGNTYNGTLPGLNLGRTLTHEVGHWFALRHIWGDDGGTCSGSDAVNDTPNQGGENYNCPTYPVNDNCNATAAGVMFMNYMDYVDDGCMNMFTTGQATRMNSAINLLRTSIKTSLGCSAPVGIQDMPLASQVSVYPNPSAGLITLAGTLVNPGHVEIRIVSMLGETVFLKALKNASGLEESIDLSGAAPGVYTITLTGKEGVINSKFVLARN